MLLYGDTTRLEATHPKRMALARALRQAWSRPPGLARHTALVGALIEAGELAQGVADAAFAARGHDALAPSETAIMALLLRLAGAVRASWESGFLQLASWPAAELAAVLASALPEAIHTRQAEGFAFYALYPEAYLNAAAALPAEPRRVRVIGLRSIGTVLAPMVAAALGTAACWTLRPTGHPFQRRLDLAPALRAAILADPAARFALVDEGPGLSGSSFAAGLDLLEGTGIPAARIHLLPGHAGPPGGQASPALRARWPGLQRHPARFDDLLHSPRAEHRLGRWAADLLGVAEAPLQDLSGGAWRAARGLPHAQWPPIHPYMERRKFLLHAEGGSWRLKFAGLGRAATARLRRAQLLHVAGFTPEPVGLCHGFLVERHIEDAVLPVPVALPRDRLVERLGRYLGFRARHFPAPAAAGASLDSLWQMARHNASMVLGEAVARPLDALRPAIPGLERQRRPVWTDNRMHVWEWLLRPGGGLLKTDALDHADAHDLVGCQDIAWDIVGARVEWSLSPAEAESLRAIVAREAGIAPLPVLIAFLTPCYLAFQMGYYSMAADASVCPQDKARAAAAAHCYAARLRSVLSSSLCATALWYPA